MSVAILRVVSPNLEVSNGFGFFDSVRDGSRVVDSIKLLSRYRSLNCHGRQLNKGQNQKPKLAVLSSMVVNSAGEMAILSEQNVYDVVMKQAALVKKLLRAKEDCDVKPDMVLPGTLSLLSEAYDRCGEVCAEYAKTFYLG